MEMGEPWLGKRRGKRQNQEERKKNFEVWYERGESRLRGGGSQWAGYGLDNTMIVGPTA